MLNFYHEWVQHPLHWLGWAVFALEFFNLCRRPLAQRRNWAMVYVLVYPFFQVITTATEILPKNNPPQVGLLAFTVFGTYFVVLALMLAAGIALRFLIVCFRIMQINNQAAGRGAKISFSVAFELAWSGPVWEYRNSLWRYDLPG